MFHGNPKITNMKNTAGESATDGEEEEDEEGEDKDAEEEEEGK